MSEHSSGVGNVDLSFIVSALLTNTEGERSSVAVMFSSVRHSKHFTVSSGVKGRGGVQESNIDFLTPGGKLSL